MRAYFLAALSLLVASHSLAQLRYTEKQVIAYAKSIDVKTLDPSLPSQRLEDWLQSGPPHIHIGHWLVADTCDLKPDLTSKDYPLCAKISFDRKGKSGFFLVQVGTSRSGIVGRPQLYLDVYVWDRNLATTSVGKLSDLPTLLD